jgi:hypothetical protein
MSPYLDMMIPASSFKSLDMVFAVADRILTGLPGTNGLAENPDILLDYPLRPRWVGGRCAH